jgi:transposase
MKKVKRKKKRKVLNLDILEQLNLNAAGVDVGASEMYVCVPAGRDEEIVRSFPTFTADLRRLADWLQFCGVDTVAMESTGVYWVPLYEILEERGLDVKLVNARHLKNVAAQKTDVLDCQWIQQLHTYGLLRGSFRPEEQVCAIRSVVRQREMLVKYRSAHIQHMQKALHLMNVQLTNVLSDITGETGMKIIRGIIAGEQDPYVLASYRHGRCAKSEEEIAKSLQGNYKREHLFALKQAVELYDFYDQQLRACDQELEALYAAFEPPQSSGEPPKKSKRKRRKNQAHFDLTTSLYTLSGVDLTQVEGIDALTAQVILSEIGTDMDKWPTAKHFCSWLGLAPQNDITGGRVIRRGTKKTTNRAAHAFRLSAQSLSRSHSALGGFYRRMKTKHGAPKAITATAHKLARIVYHMLKYQEAYRDPGESYYEEQYQQRMLRNLKRKAKLLGMQLVPVVESDATISPLIST